MKILKTLAVAALAMTLLFQTSITRADDNERGHRDHHDARATFTKWVTDWPNMAGVVGGVVGNGSFTGEVLMFNPGPVTKIVAFYHFNGPKHSFTALVHVEQTGLEGVILGVVTEGWQKGHAVKGKFTQITCAHDGISSDCYEGALEMEVDSKD